jgi:type I restriction enzyme S subunit
MNLLKGWKWTTMGDITQPIEKIHPSQTFANEFTYLDISSIDNNTQRIVAPKIYESKDSPSRARQLVHANDVLFSTVRTYLKNIAQVPAAYDGQIASTGFSVLRAQDCVDPRYLFYYCLTEQFLNPLNDLQRGTSYPAVRDSDVREQPIPLAPLPEQQRIVAKIEEQFTRLDAGVATLKRVQTALRRYKAAVLKAACEGRLVPQDPQSINTSLLDGWTRVAFEELLVELKNGHFSKAPISEPPGIPILRISAVRPLSVNFSELRYLREDLSDVSQYLLRNDDLLFTRYNGNLELVGACGMVRGLNKVMLYPDKLIRARVITDKVLPNYLEIYFATSIPRQIIEKKAKSTAGQQGISGADLKKIPVMLPPLAEQRRIVAESERRLSVVQELEATVAANLARAERLRQSILKRAFEGKLVAQDASDEPAGVLLEKIRVNRPAANH